MITNKELDMLQELCDSDGCIGISKNACAELIAAVRALQASSEAAVERLRKEITGLANGECGICDFCALCGKSKETTPCPHGCYQNTDRRSTCEDFWYKLRGPQPAKEDT